MTCSPPLLLAAATRTVFELARIQTNSDWIGPIGVTVGVMTLAWMVYRRDARELSPHWRWALTLLRTAVFFALLLLYLQPQWRTEDERRINSRVLVLVDNSLSMGMSDDTTGGQTRAGQVAASLARSRLVDRLCGVHDVSVFRFGEKVEPLLERDRMDEGENVASGGLGDENALAGNVSPLSTGEVAADSPEAIDWKASLVPAGTETRLGEALAQVLAQQREAPVSGVILITDGGQNAGAGPEAALAAARQSGIPILPVGVGSDRRTANVRVSDLVAPARAYPGDQYSVTGYLQASGLAGQKAVVELWSASADDRAAAPGGGELIESREVILGPDGEVLPVRFELSPKVVGRQTLVLAVKAPPADGDAKDNRRESDVEIVDRKTRVLLLAGGPMREYRYLRNLLYRDKSVEVDVLLQSAGVGASQEADRMLDDFPATRAEMYAYDAVVALDPDWQKLSDAQVELLERWVAEQGGGMIVVAGAVHMGNSISGWIQDERLAKIRALYPVKFQRRFATDASSYASSDPWPLDFTRDGFEAEFLWLTDDDATSRAAWAAFAGVYSFYPVDGGKPGARVLARFSDPQVGSGVQRPVWAAVQFYGSGRVLYLGSGELWRLRAVDEAYFETIYTKLLRHVEQGRLLRGSSRGTLLVDRDRYLLGSTVEVRAQLADSRLEPLVAPSVAMQVFSPRGSLETVELRADANHPGNYAGRFAVVEEGVWRLELALPDGGEDQRLSRRIQVKMPERERENPERNDALLARIARGTGGHYFVGISAALPEDESPGIVGQLKDRTKTVIVTGTPSRAWQERWLRWFMYFACGLLLVEWFVRRLVRLA
ncbi:MAG: VWA domain-containing protein [Pirellulales bacterium]|nr:VWA domain-containing protein [Pirellulales bacterium]